MNNHRTGQGNVIATATSALDDGSSVLSEMTAETKQSMPVLAPMTPLQGGGNHSHRSSEIMQAKKSILSHRRASLNDSEHYQQRPGFTSEEEDDARMNYLPGTGGTSGNQHSPSRRASLSGPTVEMIRSTPSRQGSMGMQQEFNNNPVLSAYHQRDNEEEEQQYHRYDDNDHGNARSNRQRQSFKSNTPVLGSGPTNTVLMDISGFSEDPDGYGTDNESVVSERSLRRSLSIQQKRRSSLGVCRMEQEEEEEDTHMEHGHTQQQYAVHRATTVQSQSRRGGRRDGSAERPKTASVTATSTDKQRGVSRSGTGDSEGMTEMRFAVSVPRFSTGDSITMQNMRVNDGGQNSPRRGKRSGVTIPPSEQLSVPPPSPGVAKFSTGDSRTMQSMRVSDRGSDSPRRGKRAAVQHEVPLVQDVVKNDDAPDDGVMRFATGDSVTMNQMRDSSGVENSSRRGKRSVLKIPSHWGHGDEQAPSKQRGATRYSTSDSLAMNGMRNHSGGEDGPRREHVPINQTESAEPPTSEYDEVVQVEVDNVHNGENGEIPGNNPLPNRRGVNRANTAESMELQVVRQDVGLPSAPQHDTQGRNKSEADSEQIEHVYVNHDYPNKKEDVEQERGVFRTTTADSADLRAVSQSLPRRGRRRVPDQEEPSQSQQEYVEFDNNLSDSGHLRDDVDTYDSTRFMGIQTRRGSTGAMAVRRNEKEQYFKRSFRRASTGQSQLELCPPPTPPNPSTRMGRRNSTSSMVTTRSEFSHLASNAPSVLSVRESREMSKSFNGYGAQYMQKQFNSDDSDSDEEIIYQYGDKNDTTAMYGYGAGRANRLSMIARRGSEHSRASLASRRSNGRYDLRSSKKGQELKQTAALMSGHALAHPKGETPRYESEKNSTIYGYCLVSESESLSESEVSIGSQGSRRSSRSMRRNSVVILPDQVKKQNNADPLGIGKEDAVGDDTMNLLNNSGYLEYATQVPPSSSTVDPGKEKLYAAVVAAKTRHNDATSAKPTHTLKTKDDAWGRATPFTTPRSVLTKEALERKNRSAGIPMEQSIHKLSYHLSTHGIDSSVDSSSDGGELYRDKEPKDLNDFDEFNQRPRRRESVDKTIVNMSELLHKGKKKKLSVLRFIPAVDCSNASDYIVRAFVARLRHGLTVIKHNHSRWSKSQQRELILLPDGHSLTWKPAVGEKEKGRRPKMDLLKCKEVRHAWSMDPDTRKKLGTAVIRSRCKDGSASKSFSLIFHKKTLDMTAMSTDSCKMMMEGFSALCFRLQMDKLTHKEEGQDDNYASDCNNGSHYDRKSTRSLRTDSDWASTIYGESATSKTQSNTISRSTLHSPWGL